MLSGIHFILTYTCNFECDHCFLHCSPRSQGTFTIGQVDQVLNQARKIGTVDWIFFEGGEPFLYFPLLVESIRRASAQGFKVGLVTNAYGALSEEDAALWLKPLQESGLTYLSISNDAFHYGEDKENPATIAYEVSRKLGMDTSSICIEPPRVTQASSELDGKGEPVVGGGAKFRGRAVDKLTPGLPLRPRQDLTTCPYEELETPSRVHIDAYGNVQICQGISMGNMWETPLAELVANYKAHAHPVCGPLIRGGPAALAEALEVNPVDGYVDECHFCYMTRKAVQNQHPDCMAPPQVYGAEK